MYGKLLQRFKTSYKNVQASVRTLRTTDQQHAKQEHEDKDQARKVQGANEELPANAVKLQATKTLTRDVATTTDTRPCRFEDEDNSWRSLLNSQNYKNWLKVGLALRAACEYVSPVVELIAKDIHVSLLEKHGLATSFYHRGPKFQDGWIKDVFRLHRNPPSKSQLHRISDLSLWPTQDGQWEIAKVFMSNGYPTGGSVGASTFDATALFNFLRRCRAVENYVDNFASVCRVLKARNSTMHSPRFEFTDEERDEQFEHILALFEDAGLRFHVGRSLDAPSMLQNILQIRKADLTVTAAAQSTLGIINDRILDSDSSGLTPSAKNSSLLSLKRVASNILSPSISHDINEVARSEADHKTRIQYQSIRRELDQRDILPKLVNHSRTFASEASKLERLPILKHRSSSQNVFRSISDTTVSHVADNCDILRTVRLARRFAVGPTTSDVVRRYHVGRPPYKWTCPNSKRKRDGDDDLASCSSSKRRKTDKDVPYTADEKRKKVSGSGSGGSVYRDMLRNFLSSQKENKGATFYEEKDKQGKYHATADFVSNYAIIGAHPKGSIKEAESEAASTALRWLGIKKADEKGAKLLLDIFCKAVPTGSPTYRSYDISSAPQYFTLLQIFNYTTMYYIDALATHKMFIQATYSAHECTQAATENAAARTVLEEASFDTHAIFDVKETLNDYCLKNGATLPVYRSEDWWDTKTNERCQESTVTSYVREHMLDNTPDSEDFESEVGSEYDAYSSRLHYTDLIESTSLLPSRSRKKSEESAARVALGKLGLDPSLCKDRSFKSTLEDYCLQWDFCPVYHSFQVKPLAQYPQQYECVVASPCLHSTNQQFTVRSDSTGFSNAREAKESAARNALSLLGQLPRQNVKQEHK